METTERGWSILTITISLISCYINRKEVNPVVCSQGITFYLLWDYFLIFQFTLEYRLQTFHFSSFFLLPFIPHIFLCPFENMIAFFHWFVCWYMCVPGYMALRVQPEEVFYLFLPFGFLVLNSDHHAVEMHLSCWDIFQILLCLPIRSSLPWKFDL